nr:hypothetical protein [Tanacetum cinerariifolium]
MAVEDDVNNKGDSGKKIIGSSFDINLSFGYCLYLHPNDTGGSPIVTIKLTSTENYKMWSIAMTFALRNHNKHGFINGSYKRDTDNIALANHVNSLNQNGISLGEYYNNLNSLWKQFDAMISLPPCTYKVYLAIRSNLLTREPLPHVKNAFGIISGEESHRNVSSVGTTKPAATTFAAKTFDNNQRRFNNNNFKGNNATTNNFPVLLSSKQLARLMNLLNDNGVSAANANMAGLKGKQDYRDRLGHPADQVLDALKTTLNLDIHSTSDHLCDTYGYSRAVWVYMLKEKDDVYDSINSEFNSKVEELSVNIVRRFPRQTKLPTNLNDFVIECKVKYGVVKVVSYANLNHEKKFFASGLNKSIKPTCYEEAILDNK